MLPHGASRGYTMIRETLHATSSDSLLAEIGLEGAGIKGLAGELQDETPEGPREE